MVSALRLGTSSASAWDINLHNIYCRCLPGFVITLSCLSMLNVIIVIPIIWSNGYKFQSPYIIIVIIVIVIIIIIIIIIIGWERGNKFFLKMSPFI